MKKIRKFSGLLKENYRRLNDERKAGEFIKKNSGEVIWGSEAFIDEVFKALYGNEYEYEIWSYNDALQKIKNLVQQVEGIQ